MPRVTKINVGGTNYDIAHEGELKNSGFEVVTSLPTTGLFEGREVMYQGKKYIYSSGWKEEITANTMYEANLLWGGRNIVGGISPVDAAMVSEFSANIMAFPNPAGITVEYSRDRGVTWLDYGATDKEKIDFFTDSSNLYCGKANEDKLAPNTAYMLRITINARSSGIHSILNKAMIRISTENSSGCWCTLSALIQTDYYLGNISDDYYKVLVNKAAIGGWPSYNMLNFTPFATSGVTGEDSKRYRLIRFTFGYDGIISKPYEGPHFGLHVYLIKLFGINKFNMPSNLARTNHLYSYDWQQNAYFPKKVESNEIINFDINNIEPTQTGSARPKTSTWLWQYLVQGVNWLKANNVRLSAYNTKVAALEQADNTKLDKRAYNQIYTNCGYVCPRLVTGALIIELPFNPTNDTNNSMTYIELNVYSHRKGCSKYIIGVYSYSQNSGYEWSAYSYMGYNYFSKISFGRRTDNNNIVVVLGDFTDLHKNVHFSISHIITGFNRNNDDTDGFLLYTDSNSNNYSTLISSTYISPIISYNDLTDKPTLFSGSYEDLTNKPNLAAVATSGSYNDLTDTPTLFSGSYDDLKNTPTIPSSLADLSGTISSVQIPDGLIANGKLANSSMSLNGTTVNLGDTAILPWYVDYNEVDYPARIRDHWLQIYRNGVWANLMYLGDILPTQVGQITSLDNLDWYNEQVSEYEVDSTTTTSILNGTTLPATVLLNCTAEHLTLNLYPISGKQYGKGSLDSLITDLHDKGFSVFVENDLDAIIGSGSDYLVRIKISKVPTVKAIIECYVAR